MQVYKPFETVCTESVIQVTNTRDAETGLTTVQIEIRIERKFKGHDLVNDLGELSHVRKRDLAESAAG